MRTFTDIMGEPHTDDKLADMRRNADRLTNSVDPTIAKFACVQGITISLAEAVHNLNERVEMLERALLERMQ